MKRIITISALFALSVTAVLAQSARAVFFTENGERFHLIMNGVKKTDNPESNISVSSLNGTAYKVRVIFENGDYGVATKTVELKDNTETTFTIKKKKEGAPLVKDIKSRVRTTAGNFDLTDTTTNPSKEMYAIRYLSERNLGGETVSPTKTSSQQNEAAVSGGASGTQSSGSVKSTGGNNSSNTTVKTTTSGTPGGSANISFNMNVNASGSATESETIYTETTTEETPRATSTNSKAKSNCFGPMNVTDFGQVKQSIKGKTMEDDKLIVMKQAVKNKCVSAQQVKELMGLFTFEENKLAVAKFAYDYTHDKNNYFTVNDAFQFSSSIEELDKYISTK